MRNLGRTRFMGAQPRRVYSRITVASRGSYGRPETEAVGSNIFSSILKVAAPIVGGIFGGPAGAALGSALAGAVGGSPSAPAQPAPGTAQQLLSAPVVPGTAVAPAGQSGYGGGINVSGVSGGNVSINIGSAGGAVNPSTARDPSTLPPQYQTSYNPAAAQPSTFTAQPAAYVNPAPARSPQVTAYLQQLDGLLGQYAGALTTAGQNYQTAASRGDQTGSTAWAAYYNQVLAGYNQLTSIRSTL